MTAKHKIEEIPVWKYKPVVCDIGQPHKGLVFDIERGNRLTVTLADAFLMKLAV